MPDENPLVPPTDMSAQERRHYEETGSLELYTLRKRGDEIARERTKLIQREAQRKADADDLAAIRGQTEMQEIELRLMRAKAQALPPSVNPWHLPVKPLTGSENLPEGVKSVIRRIFATIAEWTPENQQGLVDLLLAMGGHKSSVWAHNMNDALASDCYGNLELTPRALLKGSTGLKALAGPALLSDLRTLGGDHSDAKSLGGSRPGQKPEQKKGKGKGKGVKPKRVDSVLEPDTKEESSDVSPGYEYGDEEVSSYDESPTEQFDDSPPDAGSFGLGNAF